MSALGNIAHRNSFLKAIGDQGGGIGIHHGVVVHSQPFEENFSQFVVGCLEAAEVFLSETPKEGSQGVAMGEVG